ncbi:F-box protein CPR1-like [Argentina anserina]|uniref:F-box protein CPR1-like n=1 Tax=Argentina anserina TaxID=57926 RepID=UPI00217684CE|nr:F-box protein CPR1-like [Potentilla anserina]
MKSADKESSTDAEHRQIQTFLAELPPEVIINILSRLHVGRLLCLRSVAKPWRSLIDSSYFKNLHLHHSTQSKSNLTLILRKDSDLFCVDFDSLNDAVELTHPLMCYSNRIRVLGSCNGLLCICNVAEDIALWSPWIRKYRILPSLPSDRKRDKGMCLCGARVYGMGYDAVNDDYKLVRISQFVGWDSASFESEVTVFSLRRREWRKVDDMPFLLCYTRKMGIFSNGCVHWVVTRTEQLDKPASEVVAGFDVVNETFREVPMPEMDRKCQISVGHLEGWLCIVAKYEGVGVDVWSMKQYGVKESWCKLFTVKQVQGVGRLKSIRPLIYSKNGRQVLLELNHEELVWFDLEGQMVNSVKIRGLPDFFEATVCAETLVSVDPSKREDRETVGKKKKKRDDFLAEGFKLVL